MRPGTKFIPFGNFIRTYFGTSIEDQSTTYIANGVNEFEGKKLIGFSVDFIKDQYGNTYIRPNHTGFICPANKFNYMENTFRKKDGKYYSPNKTISIINSVYGSEITEVFQNVTATSDFISSGINAIGKTGTKETYRIYTDSTEYTNTTLKTSDYIRNDDFDIVPVSDLQDPEIYIADSKGRYLNTASDQIIVGYASYEVLLNEGQEDEYIARPQKNMDIVFNTEENKWTWNGYSSVAEPEDSDFDMVNESNQTINLLFRYYGGVQQQIIGFDEGGIK